MGRVLPVVLALGLTIYALLDSLRTPEDEVSHLPKPWWVVVVLLVPVLGPLAWLAVGRTGPQAGTTWLDRLVGRGTGATPPWRSQGRPTPPPRRSTAPDDDPEFLSRLRRDIEDGPGGQDRTG